MEKEYQVLDVIGRHGEVKANEKGRQTRNDKDTQLHQPNDQARNAVHRLDAVKQAEETGFGFGHRLGRNRF